MGYRDLFWHKYLRRPYYLVRAIDEGSGQPVVFLHGIAASSDAWRGVASKLDHSEYRLLAFDLLGFGDSPVPGWADYSVDDHANAVIISLRRAKPGRPVILVGHSMGAVIAARVACLRPDLVKHLILYQLPVFSDVAELGIRDVRLRAYKQFIAYLAANPRRTLRTARTLEKIGPKAVQFALTDENWPAFEQSLRNTILLEKAVQDIKAASVPTDIIYGSFDPLILRKNTQKVFKADKNVHFYKIDETHRISAKAAKILVQLIHKA